MNCPFLSKYIDSEYSGALYIYLSHLKAALQTKLQLAREFPTDANVVNQLGVGYLYVGKNNKAKQSFERVLQSHPGNGFALVHLGFITKIQGDWKKSIDFLLPGIHTLAEGTQQGKFYFHLGDALHRTNRTEEVGILRACHFHIISGLNGAKAIYKLGAERGLFRSKYQRSLYNVERLKSRPYWTAQQAKVTDYVKITREQKCSWCTKLESNWKIIRDEAMKVMDVKKGLFVKEEESLKNTGEWRQFTLFQRGKKEVDCKRVPKTCALLEQMPNAIGCKRALCNKPSDYTFYSNLPLNKYPSTCSIMMPGTHVWPHTGPTNCRLRMHLGLVIPQTGDGVRIRCADDIRHLYLLGFAKMNTINQCLNRTWEEGKVLIFDDSYEHEVWQNAETFRLILIVDVWHPDLSEREKRNLMPI
uniref:Aspartyl/asparaginy/proline hydroxylase domain-containing protein n=1 Tax=Ciona savignyi TaxID=51511 RepID=H2ZBL4_CIOSA